MKISTILDHIDSGHMSQPKFQRGYAWNSDQVRDLFASLYRCHQAGGLLVWATESRTATHRGELLHGDTDWLAGAAAAPAQPITVIGGITSEDEEAELEALDDCVESKGLPRGDMAYDLADPATGAPLAILDLAWPTGLQEELSQPVAVLLNEEAATITVASQAGFKCFTDTATFRRHVEREVLGELVDA